MGACLAAHDLDQGPSHELFQLAERLSLENGLHLLPIGRTALAQNELAHRAEAGRRDLLPFMVERLMMLEGSQTRQLFGR